MSFTKKLFLSLFVFFGIFANVNDSIIPTMKEITPENFQGKVSKQQMKSIRKVERMKADKILIMSFNMLFNLKHKEDLLSTEYHWRARFPRIVEYLQFAKPDIVGTQELYKDQVDDLMDLISDKYAYYGVKKEKTNYKGEVQAIFFDKSRFQLIEGRTYFYSKASLTLKSNSRRKENVLTYCELLDKKTGKKFIVLNTHLSFLNVQERLLETKFIKAFIDNLPSEQAVILTGDFNTFPMRFDLNLPFNDGGLVLETITNGPMENSLNKSSLGHLGPIASTNVSNEVKKPFSGRGTSGVILDFIFVNQNIYIRLHAIDPAKVNDEYMSDHFPVLAEVIVK